MAGLGHHPGGEVHRVTLDRVGAPERWAELAGEDVAAVHPDAQRQAVGRVHHGSGHSQHPLLVPARTARCARDEQDLAAVPVDVGLEERHAVLSGRGLHAAHALVQGVGDRPDALSFSQGVRTAELHEGNRDGAMLRFSWRVEDVVAQDRRQESAERLVGRSRCCQLTAFLAPALMGHGLLKDCWQRQTWTGPQQVAAVHRRRSMFGAGQQCRRAAAQHDLPRRGNRLHHGGRARLGPDHEQLAVEAGISDDIEVERPAVHARRHAK